MTDMDYDWDAIIIGGGPAGSTVARYAAEGGVKVLVIDRRKEIGTPLQCALLPPQVGWQPLQACGSTYWRRGRRSINWQ